MNWYRGRIVLMRSLSATRDYISFPKSLWYDSFLCAPYCTMNPYSAVHRVLNSLLQHKLLGTLWNDKHTSDLGTESLLFFLLITFSLEVPTWFTLSPPSRLTSDHLLSETFSDHPFEIYIVQFSLYIHADNSNHFTYLIWCNIGFDGLFWFLLSFGL